MTNQQAHLTALILRLSLGIMFVAHGLLKLIVFTPAGTAGFFASIGLPAFLGPAVMAVEIIGGILLIFGIQTRIVALALIPVLIGSITHVHGGNGWLFSAEGGGWEFPAFLVAISVAQVVSGSGKYALHIPGLSSDILEPLFKRKNQ